jgi:hypothetical protein
MPPHGEEKAGYMSTASVAPLQEGAAYLMGERLREDVRELHETSVVVVATSRPKTERVLEKPRIRPPIAVAP